MIRVFLGLMALTIFAVWIAAALHWAAGLAVIVVPIAITYYRLKLSPEYRLGCDQRIKSHFMRPRPEPALPDRNLQAKAALDKLRREELSVGASMRKGDPVDKVPGQLWSAPEGAGSPLTHSASPITAASSTPQSDPDNYPLSMTVGAATGSAALGYLSGGSITGAVIGASMNTGTTSGAEPPCI